MNMIAVDDEKIALDGLVRAIEKVTNGTNIAKFQKASEAIEYVEKTREVDVAFLDIELCGMSGIALAESLKKITPNINIIFTTGYSEYSNTAFDLHASGYLLKPVTPDKIKEELDNLRFQVKRKEENLRVRTFGKFEVYMNGNPLKFKYSKSKELLAYLIDQRGATCNNQEMECILWEDGGHTSYLKNVKADLIATLHRCGADDILIRYRGSLAIKMDQVDCDYYHWLNQEETTENMYLGEYMNQYSWAEVTHGMLEGEK